MFMWRAEMKKIPSLVALSRRNVHAESVICKLCGESDETTYHLLTSCYYVVRIWHWISNWCRISPIYTFEVRDLC
ncbi:putative reverse transcriptase zinc-binding domain-containing protein [Helianthus anomalus]